MLNTMVYYIKFPGGSIYKYEANIIANNIYSQFDSQGFSHSILSIILEFYKDSTAAQKGDQYIIINSGQRRIKK